MLGPCTGTFSLPGYDQVLQIVHQQGPRDIQAVHRPGGLSPPCAITPCRGPRCHTMAWSCSGTAGTWSHPCSASQAPAKPRVVVKAWEAGAGPWAPATTPPEPFLLQPRPLIARHERLADDVLLRPVLPSTASQPASHHHDAGPGLHQPPRRPQHSQPDPDLWPDSAMAPSTHQRPPFEQQLDMILEQHQDLARAGALPTAAARLLLSDSEIDVQELQQALQPLSLDGHAVLLAACAQSELKLPDQVVGAWGEAMLPLLLQELRAAAAAGDFSTSAQLNRLAHRLAALLTITTCLGKLRKYLGVLPMSRLLLLLQPHCDRLSVSQLVRLAEALCLMSYFPYITPADHLAAPSARVPREPAALPPHYSSNNSSSRGAFNAAQNTHLASGQQQQQPPHWMQQFLQVVLQRIDEFSGAQICALLRSLAQLDYHPWATHRDYLHLKAQLVTEVAAHEDWHADLMDMLATPRQTDGVAPATAAQHKAGDGLQQSPDLWEVLYPHEVQMSLWTLNHFNLPVRQPWLKLLFDSCGQHVMHLTPKALGAAFKVMADYRVMPSRGVQQQLWQGVLHKWQYMSYNRMYAILWHAQQAQIAPPATVAELALRSQINLARRIMAKACKSLQQAARPGQGDACPLDVRRVVHMLWAAAQAGVQLQPRDCLPLTWVLCQTLHRTGSSQLITQGMYSLAMCCPGLANTGKVATTPVASSVGVSTLDGGALMKAHRQQPAQVLATKLLRAVSAACLPVITASASPAQYARFIWATRALGLLPPVHHVLAVLRKACTTQQGGAQTASTPVRLPAYEAILLLLTVADIGWDCLLGSAPRGGTSRQGLHNTATAKLLLAQHLTELVPAVEALPPDALHNWQSGMLPKYMAALVKLNLQQHANPAWWSKACALLGAQLHSMDTSQLVLLLKVASVGRAQPSSDVALASSTGQQQQEDTATAAGHLLPRSICTELSTRPDLLQLPPADLVHVSWSCAQSKVYLSQVVLQQVVEAWQAGILQLGPTHLPRTLLAAALHELHWQPHRMHGSSGDDAICAVSPAGGMPGAHVAAPVGLIRAVLAVPVAQLTAAWGPDHNWGADYAHQQYVLDSQQQLKGWTDGHSHGQASWNSSQQVVAAHVVEHVARVVCGMTPNQLSTLLLGVAYWARWTNKQLDTEWLDAYLGLIKSRGAGIINWLGVTRLVTALLVLEVQPTKTTYNYLSRLVKGLRKAGQVSIEEDLEIRQMLHQLEARVQQQGVAAVPDMHTAAHSMLGPVLQPAQHVLSRHEPVLDQQQHVPSIVHTTAGRRNEELKLVGPDQQVFSSPVLAAYHMASQLLRHFYLQQLYGALDVMARTLGRHSSETKQPSQHILSVADWALALLQESWPGSRDAATPHSLAKVLNAGESTPEQPPGHQLALQPVPVLVEQPQMARPELAQVVVELDVGPPSPPPSSTNALISQLYDRMTFTLARLATSKGIASPAAEDKTVLR